MKKTCMRKIFQLAGLAFIATLGVATITGTTNTQTVTSTGGGSTNPCTNPPKTAWCVNHKKCCNPEFPHHCENTHKCYQYFTDAQAACGNSYEICGGPIGRVSFDPGSDPSAVDYEGACGEETGTGYYSTAE